MLNIICKVVLLIIILILVGITILLLKYPILLDWGYSVAKVIYYAIRSFVNLVHKTVIS